MSIAIRLEEDKAVIEISRMALFEWLTGETQRREDASGPTVTEPLDEAPKGAGFAEPGDEVKTETTTEGTIDLFEEKNGIGGSLEEGGGAGRKKGEEIGRWLKKNKFNQANFCRFLYDHTEIAGWKLSSPLIGCTEDGTPLLLKLATRYYSFWKSQKDTVAREYKNYVLKQLEKHGYTVQAALEIFEGSKEVDPKTLPKGTEVSV